MRHTDYSLKVENWNVDCKNKKLRILTEKKHPKIKLTKNRSMDIWIVGTSN